MYDLWYCPNYPIEDIMSSRKTDRTGREEIRARLAEDIRENGLVNPLVVFNHRGHKYMHYHCMQGLNRLEALKILGWSTVPCIVTGECNHNPKVLVPLEQLQDYFPDGEVTIDPSQQSGPKIINVIRPETYKYPFSKWAYRHEDYQSLPVRDA
jgi:hypothetical protein